MSHVTRAEAQGLLTDLKDFAFEQSPQFRDGTHAGFEVMKNFYHHDPLPFEARYELSPEMCKSTFTFTAFRMPGLKFKPAYNYLASAAVERSLPILPLHMLNAIAPSVRKVYDDFEEIEEGALCEESSTCMETSDHELREINRTMRYVLTYAGDTIYQATDQDILHGHQGEFVDVPEIENTDSTGKIFVPIRIEHERLSDTDSILTDSHFWDLIEPLTEEGEDDAFRAAATAMRSVVRILRTGEVF
jgi:hypothetical protein